MSVSPFTMSTGKGLSLLSMIQQNSVRVVEVGIEGVLWRENLAAAAFERFSTIRCDFRMLLIVSDGEKDGSHSAGLPFIMI